MTSFYGSVSCVLLAIASVTLSYGANFCKISGREHWTCKHIDDCWSGTSANLAKQTASLCGGNTSAPMICCPPSRVIRSIQKTKANTYCENQAKKCPSTFKWTVNSIVKPKDEVGSENLGLKPSPPSKHPHMALVGYGDAKIWNCAGSLISERFVLTSAYCCHNPELGPAMWVRLGVVDAWSPSGQDYAIATSITHPGYKQPLIYNDLALFRLDREVKFNKFIKPACLHTMPKVPYGEVTTTGWGKTNYGGSPGRLLELESAMIQIPQCNTLRRRDAMTPQGVKQDVMLCSGTMSNFGDSCKGFAGGPLVIKKSNGCLHTIIGVASFGRLCTDHMCPGIYARISNYIPWIESIVWP